MACFRSPSIMLWWAQVTVTPEESNTAVLRRGTPKGSRGVMPVGGQQPPISGVGARLEWKKAQKKPKKKKTSEVMKRIIPNRRPFCTGGVWCPWKVPSRTISRHHWYIVSRRRMLPRTIRVIEL